MQIHGFQKLTLLDYPGHLAATVFFAGCNFRCPFCHNKDLVLPPYNTAQVYEDHEIISHLKKRRGILEGVCITGGEATLQKDLPLFLNEIKKLGYHIKLDTNGTNPDLVRSLYHQNLIDYVAMDIKSSPAGYPRTAGIDRLSMKPIFETADFLLSSGIDYEFRTTIVKELHMETDFHKIGQWLSGARKYFLQAYRESPYVITDGFHSFTYEETEYFCNILNSYSIYTQIRGIEKGA